MAVEGETETETEAGGGGETVWEAEPQAFRMRAKTHEQSKLREDIVRIVSG